MFHIKTTFTMGSHLDEERKRHYRRMSGMPRKPISNAAYGLVLLTFPLVILIQYNVVMPVLFQTKSTGWVDKSYWSLKGRYNGYVHIRGIK